MIIGTIAIVAVMIGIGVIVNRKFALEPEQLARTPAKPRKGLITAHEIGEAPATALRASEAQVAKLKPSLPCKGGQGPRGRWGGCAAAVHEHDAQGRRPL